MLTHQQIAAYLEDQLPAPERAEFEVRLSTDPELQRDVADQLSVDLLLRVLLGKAAAQDRVKASIFTVLRGATPQQLTAQVMRQSRGEALAPALPTGSGSRLIRALRRSFGLRTRPPSTAPETGLFRWRRPPAFAVAFGCAVLLLLAGLFLYLQSPPAAPIRIGQFAKVVGAPMLQPGAAGLRSRTSSPQQVVNASTPIHLGDRLETGDADKAEIAFKDGTTLRLGFNTIIEIAESKVENRSPGSAPLRPSEIRLLQGEIWTQVQTLTNARQYAIHTEAATAIARGTEFGVKLLRASAGSSQLSTPNSQLPASPTAVLSVKEGVVDFTNALGSVQATAMTESTARADLKPTEPKRLQTLQVVRLGNSVETHTLSSQLDWPDTAERLSLGGGWAGFKVRDFPLAPAGTNEIRVIQVSTNSPAANAGLRTGDVLTAMEGQALTEASQVSRALLLRSDTPTSLTVRRGNQEVTVTLTARHRSALLAGPGLSVSQAGEVGELTRKWAEEGVAAALSIAPSVRDLAVRGAAENNLGVLLEAGDEMGPAIRAYGRAVRAAPQVPLYRFNLGLALRKIGSFDRASEELASAVQLAPESVEARKRWAEVQSLLGNDTEALAQTEAALEMAPEDHGLWELKARLLSRLGRNAEVAEAARKAVETGPGCPVALMELAGALSREGNVVEAEKWFRQALERDPYEPAAYANLGSFLSKQGDLREAETAFRKAIELRPDFVLAYQGLAETLGDQRQWSQAQSALQKAAEFDPGDVGLARDYGRLFFKQGRHAEAETHFRRALEVSPYQLDLYFDLGEVLVRIGRLKEAEQIYLQAVALEPTHAEPVRELATFYRDWFQDVRQAQELYRKAIQLAPKEAQAYRGLNHLLIRRGNLAEAESLMRQARELLPNTGGIHNDLGEVLRMRGQLGEAEACYRRALELAPGDPEPYNNLGIVYAMRGDYAEAEKIFRNLVERAAANARLYPLNFLINLAMACERLGKVGDAEEHYRQALSLAPDNPQTLNALAWFLADQHRNLEEALTFARRAVQIAPNDPHFLDTLGWVLFQRGDLQEAEQTLRKALELAGENPPSAEIREHLDKVRERKEQKER